MHSMTRLHVFLWFKRKPIEGVPITGPILCEEAVQLHQKLYGVSQVSGSTGWQLSFCKCHGITICNLKVRSLLTRRQVMNLSPPQPMVERLTVTINACANAAATIKLPLQLIGKAKRLRCSRGLQIDLLPVE